MQGTAETPAFEGVFGWVGRLFEDWARALLGETHPAMRLLRDWAAPLYRARNTAELARALDDCAVATIALCLELVRVLPTGQAHAETAADSIQKLHWLLSRATSRLGEETAVAEYVARLQLHLTVAWEQHAARPVSLQEVGALDLSLLKADPLAWPFLQGFAGFLGMLCLHKFDFDAEGWRRRGVLAVGLDALRCGLFHLPGGKSVSGLRSLLTSARRYGLWLRALKPEERVFEEMLGGAPANRGALETLRVRFEAPHPWIYVGDVEPTFVSLMPEVFAAVEVYLKAGEQYECGDLPIEALARAWAVDVPGVLIELERLNFQRPSEVLRLTDDNRQARLAKLRADRLARGGAPRPDPAVMDRAVIASQRIEGIDARAHLPERPRERA